jgi:hypothetical protein
MLPAFPLTPHAMVEEIDSAFSSQPDTDDLIWYRTRWSRLPLEQRLAWADRRMAPLMIIWTRGGTRGFIGLGMKLDAALHAIDR